MNLVFHVRTRLKRKIKIGATKLVARALYQSQVRLEKMKRDNSEVNDACSNFQTLFPTMQAFDLLN